MSKFGGIPVEEDNASVGSRFGGIPVEEETQKAEAPGLLSRIAGTTRTGISDWMSTVAGDTYGRSGDPTERDDLSPISRIIKAAGGDIVPAIGEMTSDVISTGYQQIPESIREPVENTAISALVRASQTPYGKAIGSIASEAGSLMDAAQEESPEGYALASDLANIGAMAVPAPKAKPKFGVAAKRKLSDLAEAQKKDDLESRFVPTRDKIFQLGDADIEKGPLKVSKFQPGERYQKVLDEVANTPGVSFKNSHTENRNALLSEVGRLDDVMLSKLDDASAISSESIDDALLKAMEESSKIPILAGDSERVAERIYDAFNDIVVDNLDESGNITAKDLLKARRQLDSWLKSTGGSQAFGDKETAVKVATRQLRTALNDLVDKSSPSAEVKKTLSRQNKLLTATEMTEPKVLDELNTTRIGRAIDRLEESTGLKAPVNPISAEQTLSNPRAGALALALAGLSRAGRKAGMAAQRNKASGIQGIASSIELGQEMPYRAALIELLRQDEEMQ